MADTQLPNCVIFGWLSQPWLKCGPRRRWKDVTKRFVHTVAEDEWYKAATSRTV